jgi:hypothetical protein
MGGTAYRRGTFLGAQREKNMGILLLLLAIMMVIFVLVALLAIVVVILIKANSGRGPSQPEYPPDRRSDPRRPASGVAAGPRPHLQPAADGFWIHTHGLPVGSVVHYRYHVSGAPHHSTLVVEPGGRQFVYTGDAPELIDVTQVDRTDDGSGFTSGGTPDYSPNQTQYDSSRDPTARTEDSSGDFSVGGDFGPPDTSPNEVRSGLLSEATPRSGDSAGDFSVGGDFGPPDISASDSQNVALSDSTAQSGDSSGTSVGGDFGGFPSAY